MSQKEKMKKEWVPSPHAEAAPPARAQNLRTIPMESFSLFRLPASRSPDCIIEIEISYLRKSSDPASEPGRRALNTGQWQFTHGSNKPPQF